MVRQLEPVAKTFATSIADKMSPEVVTGENRGRKLLTSGSLEEKKAGWLGGRDSNPDTQIQSLQSYH